MAVTVEIRNQQRRIPLHLHPVDRIIKTVLQAEGIVQAELSVVFVTDTQIRALNKTYLRHDGPTDVLAFDLSGPLLPEGKGTPRRRNIKSLEGELVISTTTAARQAKEYQTSPFQEVALYLVHGILHLCGYDDHCQRDISKMRKRERELMELLGRKKYLA